MWLLSFAFPIILIVVALAEFIHPFGPPFLQNGPILLLILGLLLGARHAARRAARQREAILKEVPKKPLGLSDD